MLALGEVYRYGMLRMLGNGDEPLMLEWMHEPTVVSAFSFDFLAMGELGAFESVCTSWPDESNLHFAIEGEKG